MLPTPDTDLTRPLNEEEDENDLLTDESDYDDDLADGDVDVEGDESDLD